MKILELLNANALWELADFTENKLSPPLIDKCIETLTCINPGLNYYFKALLKLTDFTLIKLADPQISIVEQREWVKNGLSWAFNIHSGGIDIAQKISLSLLNKNLLNDNPEIFPVTKKTKKQQPMQPMQQPMQPMQPMQPVQPMQQPVQPMQPMPLFYRVNRDDV